MIIRAIISADGKKTEILVLNAPEDLKHDYEYFIAEAKRYAPEGQTVIMHQRFLRTSLFLLFAHAEAVVNGWLHDVLVKRSEESKFDRLERKSLDEKIDFLVTAIAPSQRGPNLLAAKQLRNIWIHGKQASETVAFDALSLDTIEQAATELESWMSALEKALGVERYLDSGEVANKLSSAMGTVTNSANSNPLKGNG
jgi:hypothetical protein